MQPLVQSIVLESCSNSKDMVSLIVGNEKKFQVLVFVFLWVTS